MALKILVCAQNEWYTQPIPCQARGGVDTAITLGGSGENSDLIKRLPNPNGRTVSQHVCFR